MIRRFSLTNGRGDTWSLDRPGYCFLYEPEGLGYAESANYERLGTAWVSEDPKPQQATIRGEIIFPGRSPYEAYRAFGRFLRYDQLTLLYETPAGSFYRKVRAAEITKTEIVEGFILRCDLRLVCMGLWYTPARVEPIGEVTILTDAAGNYLTDAAGNILTTNLGDYTVVNQGDVAMPFTLEIQGPVSNPVFSMTRAGKTTTITFPVEVASGQRLVYSSVDGDLYCRVMQGSTLVQNVVPLFGATVDVFKKIPVGTYEVSVDGSGVTIGAREEYKRV